MGTFPVRFIEITQEGYADDLRAICTKLIEKPETLEQLDRAFKRHPTLLTLEDFVARFGTPWGFSTATVHAVKEWVAYFDKLVGEQRFQSSGSE